MDVESRVPGQEIIPNEESRLSDDHIAVGGDGEPSKHQKGDEHSAEKISTETLDKSPVEGHCKILIQNLTRYTFRTLTIVFST